MRSKLELKLQLLQARSFVLTYDGENTETEDPPVDPPASDPALESDKNKKEKVKLDPKTQAYVNSLLAEERRKAEKKNNDLITQLETERNRATTTAAEKQQLDERIEQLKGEFATKEELATRDTQKKLKELEDQKKKSDAEARTWQDRFRKNKVNVDLNQAAVTEKAFNPNQVVTILTPMTRLVEVTGDDGKPTGEYETRIKLTSKDKEGKPVVLDLTPTEAVKQLKEMPEEYGNLFISGANGGLGLTNLNRGGGSKPAHELSTAEYIAERRKARKAGGR